MRKKVIFTDLDGTLIDNKYSFKKAEKALGYLKGQDIPIVFCSSKTRAEIEVYRKRMGNKHPFISENGGAIFIPRNYFDKYKTKEPYHTIKFGTSYKKLIKALKSIKKQVKLRAFHEMSAKEVAENSGLSLKEAKLAKKREYDETFYLKNKKDEKKLIKLIKKHKLNYTKGGKYYHILGNSDKGKAVRFLINLYIEKYKEIETISFGDSQNDFPMLKQTDKSFLVKGPGEWNKIITRMLGMDKEIVRKGEKLYKDSVKIIKDLQLPNGAILASPPSSRYPYIYPRDHVICILAFIEEELFDKAKEALEFIFKIQKTDGSYPQRANHKGKDVSYKPIQLDNTGLVLYAFAKYIKKSKDKQFLKKYKKKIRKSISYLKKSLTNKNLFFTKNSVHEFPPYEEGLEIWANCVCYGALKELSDIGVDPNISLRKIRGAIQTHLWNGKQFIKNIRLKEASSVVNEVDASLYAPAEFGVFHNKNKKIKTTVKLIEKHLWHKKLGGICRYVKDIGRNNGGWGPWPHFTLMICKYYIKTGNRKEAEKYLNWIFKIAYNGKLPEHIATKKDFEEWVYAYDDAGIMRRDRKVVARNVRKHPLYKEKGIAYSVLPLAWPHAEFIRTWLLYKERFIN